MGAGGKHESESTFKKWAQSTSAHGVAELVQVESRTLLILWSSVLCVSLAVMLFTLTELSTQYSQRKWTTSVVEKTIPENEMEAVRITVCHYNRLNQVAATENGFDEDMKAFFFENDENKYCFAAKTNTTARKKYEEWRRERNTSFIGIYKEIGNSCKDTIIAVKYGHHGVYVNPCEPNEETLESTDVYTSEFGKCFQLSVKDRQIQIDGKNDYSMFLRMPPERYLTDVQNNYLENGFVLHINRDTKVDFSSRGRILVPPGFEASIGMKFNHRQLKGQEDISWFRKLSKTVIELLGCLTADKPPCRECDMELKYFSGIKYTRDNCLKDCTTGDHFYHNCGCIPYMFGKNGTRVCEMEEVRDCLESFKQRNSSDRKRQDECVQLCEPPCYEEFVTTSLGIVEYPSPAVMGAFRNAVTPNLNEIRNYTDEQLKRQFSVIKLYLDSQSVRVVEMYQDATLDKLVSNIGGAMGLWTGMSFLTVFHAFVFFVSACLPKKRDKDEVVVLNNN